MSRVRLCTAMPLLSKLRTPALEHAGPACSEIRRVHFELIGAAADHGFIVGENHGLGDRAVLLDHVGRRLRIRLVLRRNQAIEFCLGQWRQARLLGEADNAQLLAARLGRRLPVYFVDLRLRKRAPAACEATARTGTRIRPAAATQACLALPESRSSTGFWEQHGDGNHLIEIR